MRPYFFDLENNITKPLYIRLYERIKSDIASGDLDEDTRMPSIRSLSSTLGLSRNTIESAYQQLVAEGYIISKPKSGYYVVGTESFASLNISCSSFSPGPSVELDKKKGVRYDFSSDYIDTESFRLNIWKKYIQKALKESALLFSYGNNSGEYALRKEIAKYLHLSRGVNCSSEQIIIGAGIQPLLHLFCAMIDPDNSLIAFENPGFRKAQYIFSDHRFKIVPIASDDDGINISSLMASAARIVYVNPSHQFPLGTTMSIKKRNQLIKWARENDAMIIEDDYDSEFRYFGKPIPSLQGQNADVNVFYLGSFSKLLIPSMRISYMVVPPRLLNRFEAKISRYNQTSSTIEQLALADFIRDGMLDRHIRRMRKLYTSKNTLLIDSVKRIMKDKVKILGKDSGVHILLELDTPLSLADVTDRASQAGVRTAPVSNYYISHKANSSPQVVLSYAGIKKEDILPAIKLLDSVWFGK